MQWQVSVIPLQLYTTWRTEALRARLLHETKDGVPSERLLQQIWRHQRVRPEPLETLDGQPVRVLHPGFWNREAGPDFRRAVIQFGDELPRTGDVEVDLQLCAWRGHGHDRNPAFARVILHVVWDAEDRLPCVLPTLTLRSRLDAPLDELVSLLGFDAPPPPQLPGQCARSLGELPETEVTELLRQAALVRLQQKAAAFEARAKEAGWEQALWEGLFAALGYKHNTWPLRRLAERLPQLVTGPAKSDPFHVQARLLGVGGLLPAELTRAQAGTDAHLRRLWDIWWRERGQFAELTLPRATWHLAGVRPANHPQRRLALAAHWLAWGDLPARLEKWFTASLPEGALEDALLEFLRVEHDDFWAWHWTLRSPRLARPQPLLGAPRATDLAVNIILPWLWMRAVVGANDRLRREAELRYLRWPRAEDNATLRLARQRLLGGERRGRSRTAAQQQGLLQIVRDFCDHSDALCADCHFPGQVDYLNRELARAVGAEEPA
jgi:hypothetical protein